jgi:predicted HTH transcriptional regulator
MHRDYSNLSGYVAVAVFDDRIEVGSIGGLPRGFSDMLASVFHYMGFEDATTFGDERMADGGPLSGLT